jgi:tetratricopeptide (TPR) repeat protein
LTINVKARRARLNYTEAINQAASLLGAGRLDDAEELCSEVLKANAGDYNATLLMGIVKSQQGSRDAALAYFDRALRANPQSYDALFNSALTLQALERDSDALDRYDRALAVKPGCIESLNNRGNVLQSLKRHAESIASYDRALALSPNFADALNNRGNALRALGRHAEAVDTFNRALVLKPGHAEALNHRGGALQALQRYSEALASYDQALSLNSLYPEAWNNRGVTLQCLRRYGEAMASFDTALTQRRDYADALWNKSLLLLLTGDFDEGWALYEWRSKRTDAPPATAFAAPLWLGSADVNGKRLLLHAEQGLGDTIMFSRYATLVAARGATVILAVQQALRSLLAKIDGVAEVVSPGDPSPQYDLQCPLMSLPRALKTALNGIPGEVSYVRAEEPRVARWSARLGHCDRPRIGIAWSTTTAGENRSIPLRLLAPLLALPVEWICLQKDVAADDRAALAGSRAVRLFDTEIEDFADTAALVHLCDLTISIDTAVAHVAGALGKPLWLLLPFAAEWRWLTAREDSPWYPSARLFRTAAPGDWTGTIERVKRELQLLSTGTTAVAT